MNLIMKTIDTMSTARLRREADHLEAVKNELAKRDAEAAHAQEKAEAEAQVKRNSARVSELTQSYVKTADDAKQAAQELDVAILGLRAWQRRDVLQVQLRDLADELVRLGAPTPPPSIPQVSDEALRVAQDLWSPLGIELGQVVVARPLLVFR